MSAVSADITISGKLFHTFTIWVQKKIFLNHLAAFPGTNSLYYHIY